MDKEKLKLIALKFTLERAKKIKSGEILGDAKDNDFILFALDILSCVAGLDIVSYHKNLDGAIRSNCPCCEVSGIIVNDDYSCDGCLVQDAIDDGIIDRSYCAMPCSIDIENLEKVLAWAENYDAK